ncbi:MAG: GDP-mannose 4,6-dehydratase [Gemmatimonadaceae bacterium]
MPCVVIFGANGQDGHYLAAHYQSLGWQVVSVSRTGSALQGDVGSFERVTELVRGYKPEVVYHLAALSTTRHDAMFENNATIGTGALNVLEAVHRWHRGCRVFLAGSGVQFENHGLPIHETDPFEASSSYAVERIHAVYAARYFRGLGVSVYVGYLFHHESPLRKPGHVSQRVVLAARRIAAGSDETLEMGDITVEKEWGFAGDIAEGMATLVHQDQIFEAVIGTGHGHSIEEWLSLVFEAVGQNWRAHVKLQEGFRPEYARLISRPATMHSLGWKPKVGLAELATLMVRS